MASRRHLRLLLAAIADGVIRPTDLDPRNPRAYLRLGFVLAAYREKRELEWNRFAYQELATILRAGLVDRSSAEAVQRHKVQLYRDLRSDYLCLPRQSEEAQLQNYGTMWEQAFGKLTDENVTASVDSVVAALAAARQKNLSTRNA